MQNGTVCICSNDQPIIASHGDVMNAKGYHGRDSSKVTYHAGLTIHAIDHMLFMMVIESSHHCVRHHSA